MVDVRVRQQHEGDAARIEVEAAVLRLREGAALEHAAVDEKADLAGVDEEARAGDLAGRAVKRELHLPRRGTSSR